MFHCVWQRRRMTSMSSPKRIIFECWLPKRKVTLLMTIFRLVAPYEEWKIEHLKQNQRACPFLGNCKSFKLLLWRLWNMDTETTTRTGRHKTVEKDKTWHGMDTDFKSMVFSLCIQINPSLMNLQHPFINFWKCILQNN